MSENKHPAEIEALALTQDGGFCEWLDLIAPNDVVGGWPHNATTANRWLCQECGVESLGCLSTNAEGWREFRDVVRRYQLWADQMELEL